MRMVELVKIVCTYKCQSFILDQTFHIPKHPTPCFITWPKCESHFLVSPSEILIYLPGKRITVRQTRDPYVHWTIRQYIAYGKVSLESNGELGCEALSKLGLEEPGEKYWVCSIVSFW